MAKARGGKTGKAVSIGKLTAQVANRALAKRSGAKITPAEKKALATVTAPKRRANPGRKRAASTVKAVNRALRGTGKKR